MAIAREKAAPRPLQRTSPETNPLNAQQVTSIAMSFLKSLGHKKGVKPKHVFVENQRYLVEVEIGKKMLAKVQIDTVTSEIKEYAIEKKTEEETTSLPVEPKAILIMVAVSVVVSLIFTILDLQTILSNLF
ncbi:MAG: hypothetical protein OEY24_06295 [Candidatus Bathyarchaeota archaeon]|nr:hypothetical protein [Candidatus Bathyarchaeota archaeon]MDH5495296.1 hypothetical protein [Candidatus Bathyarchaeota archaeon]